MAFPGAIWIDRDAAGYGWYIDPSPAADAAFPAAPGSDAYGKVDLHTVVEHELGHELGFDDTAGDGLMGEYLAPGTRRVPAADLRTVALSAGQQRAAAEVARLLVSEGNHPGTLAATPQGAAARRPADRSVVSSQAAAGGAWTLTLSTGGLAPATSAVFAQAEDNYDLFGDPFAITFRVI
jgi:hypothetical protein